MKRFLFLTFLFVCQAMAVLSQDITVRVATGEPPHYVGVGVIVQLTVEGLEAKPEPVCEIENLPNGFRASLLGLNPQVMRQLFQSRNGIQTLERVTYNIQYRITSNQPGDFDLGPFKITQGSTEKEVDGLTMYFQDVPKTDDMRVKLVMPKTAYPDQRVPVTVEWWFAGDLENLNELSIYSPLFDDFRFGPDQPAQRGRSRMPIQTADGDAELSASARRESEGDRTFTVLSAQRTLIPDRPGTYTIEPIVATVQLVTQWQQRRSRSLFDDAFFGGGGRRPAKVERFRASGEPISFEVKPFPINDQPESFAGMVGKGFSLEAAADRTVVRVGDPIRLTLRLRGDGNVDGASMPPLSANGGLDPRLFRLPEGDLTGAIQDDGVKEFVVSIRVKEQTVNEIPGIAYSWFDTDSEQYLTTRSDPIALRVDQAVLVGADSVVTGQAESPSTENVDSGNDAMPAKAKRAFTLTGADLAIESNPARLLRKPRGFLGSATVQAMTYGAGTLLLFFAVWDRRRQQVDPETRRRREIIRDQRRRITDAKSSDAKAAAREISDALRLVMAELPNSDRSMADPVVSRCERALFQPDSTGDRDISGELADEAIRVIEQITKGALS
ncbi:MAG: hypothetical protein AAGD07_16590 [Planctomycetota bacterium]